MANSTEIGEQDFNVRILANSHLDGSIQVFLTSKSKSLAKEKQTKRNESRPNSKVI